jgi:antitoxin VapB
MAINIKSAEAERLARQLAEQTGESITEAVEIAVRERLDRLRAAADFERYAAPVRRVQQRIRERPILDARSADEIVGYDAFGAPSIEPARDARPGKRAKRRAG